MLAIHLARNHSLWNKAKSENIHKEKGVQLTAAVVAEKQNHNLGLRWLTVKQTSKKKTTHGSGNGAPLKPSPNHSDTFRNAVW